MFKRSTKLTALLVAAASVASTVPAMAATKLATKDGTVENAVAYKDGKYLYQGYRSDDDDNGLYIGDGSEKDKMLDDAEDLGIKFGDKYVSAFDGDDEYVVDLETGKISDEDILGDIADTAKTKLENKLDNAERYKRAFDKDGNFTGDVIKARDNRFEDNYYVFNKEDAQTVGTEEAPGTGDLFGYTNEAGKYIDCSYDLNLYVYSTPTTGAGADAKMVKIEDVEDKVIGEDDEEITVKDIQFVRHIGQDDKYIYSVIAVTIENSYAVKTNELLTGDKAVHYYVQKVSKEQGDKQDDAYLPKSTECFEIAPEEVLGNGDVKDAYQMLLADMEIINPFDGKEVKEFTGKGVTFSVVDGVIYAYFRDSEDKIKTFKIVTRTSEKLDRYYSTKVTKDGKTTEEYTKDRKSSKVSGRVAKKDGDKDHDMTEWNGENRPYSVDVNGALWIIDEGKVYKSVKMGDFEEVYTCDRSLDCIDVYDENNLILWEEGGDVYTTVGEGSKAAEEEAKEIVGETATTEPAVTAKTGWDQLADGTWNLYNASGAKVTGWANVGGTWYYMDPITAAMKTGWVNDNGTWYYCNASGAMQTGWVNDNGTWYYCNASGAMQTGWLNDNGTWYYLNANGSMAANTTVDGYVLGANGAWVK